MKISEWRYIFTARLVGSGRLYGVFMGREACRPGAKPMGNEIFAIAEVDSMIFLFLIFAGLSIFGLTCWNLGVRYGKRKILAGAKRSLWNKYQKI